MLLIYLLLCAILAYVTITNILEKAKEIRASELWYYITTLPKDRSYSDYISKVDKVRK